MVVVDAHQEVLREGANGGRFDCHNSRAA